MFEDSPKVLHDESKFLVIFKPPNFVVNDSNTTHSNNTVQEWLSQMSYPISNDRKLRSGIVHRLDKETSGLLIVAKTKDAFENLQGQFKNREVTKKYIALLHGKLEKKIGEIEATIGRLPWNRERFGVYPLGRNSFTKYKLLSVYKKGNDTFSLVEYSPKTGRTHQLRVHSKFIGHPIVSDPFYAGRKTARNDRKWCPRLFLHATNIKFLHPKTNKSVEFGSDLPNDLKQSLNILEKFS